MKRVLFCLVFFILAFNGFSQKIENSAPKMLESILETKEVTFGQVAYLSALYQGFISETATEEEAIKSLYKRRQIPYDVNAYTVVAAVNLAYIFSNMWNIRGGLMFYSTNGSPRYAFKQLKKDGVIPSFMDPKFIMTGEQALLIYNRGNSVYGVSY